MQQVLTNRQSSKQISNPSMVGTTQGASPMSQMQQLGQNLPLVGAPMQISHGQNISGQIPNAAMVQGPTRGSRLDPLEEILGTFPIVRLRGMPFEASVDDVLRFFQGAVVLDVVIIVRADGRGTGEALVLFSNHMDLNLALSRDKQHMGRRYIEVFQAKRADYYVAIMGQMQQHPDHRMGMTPQQTVYRNGSYPQLSMVNQQPFVPTQHQNHNNHNHSHMHGISSMNSMPLLQPQGFIPSQSSPSAQSSDQHSTNVKHTGVIRMRGLPFTATKGDIMNFFQGLNVLDESVKFVMRSDGRVTGEAFVTLCSAAEAEAAMSLHGNHMGNRYVELFPSAIEEAARHIARHRS